MNQRVHVSPAVNVFGLGSLAQWIAIAGALGLPTLALSLQGGANTAYFVMLLAALLGAAALTFGAGRVGRDSLGQGYWAHAWPVALAMAVPILAVLWSQLLTSDWNGRPYDGMTRLLLSSILAWWLFQLPAQRVRWWALGCILGAVLACWVMWQSIPMDDPRPTPPYATAITFGNLALLLGLFSGLSLGWQITPWRAEAGFKLLGLACGLYGSFLSQSRGGWLALPIIIAVLLLVMRFSWQKKLALVVLSVAGLGLTYVSSPMVQERVTLAAAELQEFQRGDNLESSIGMRMQFWQASWEMFRENPLTGVGSPNINQEFRERVAQGKMAPHGATFNHSHNELLWFMASWGVPGLIALLAVYLVPWWTFVQAARASDHNRRVAGCMGVALVTGFACFGLTEAMFAITMNVAFYAGTVAVLLALSLPRALPTPGYSS